MRKRWFVPLALLAAAVLAAGAASYTQNKIEHAERVLQFQSDAFAIGTTIADTDAHTFIVPSNYVPGRLSLEISNTGGVALTDLALRARAHGSGSWFTLLSGSNWADTTIASLRFCSSTTANTLASGATVLICIDIPGPLEFQVAASSASAGQLTVYGTVAQAAGGS